MNKDSASTKDEALLDAAGWLSDAAALLDELREDLQHFYVPEKGWPPHIQAAQNVAGDCRQMAEDARAAAIGDAGLLAVEAETNRPYPLKDES